jgi:formyltetrahydrofolate deformylase
VADGSDGRLLIACPDGPGIVAAVAGFLHERGANIVASDQFSTHAAHGEFFMRVSFHWGAPVDRDGFEHAFGALAQRFAMRWRVAYADERKRVVIMVSREDHCLADLLWRHRRGELDMVRSLGIDYHHVPVAREAKAPAEPRQLELIGAADVVVLARYMQILSADFLKRVGCPVINIHHSFLPAFAGAEPYQRAHARGVKLIGATAHYATEILDDGPIIAQDVQRVSHRDTVSDLVRIGRDVERVTLARALHSHLDDRIVVHDGRTVVF